MKILKIIMIMALSQQLSAQEFTITPLEEGLDLSSLDSNIKVKQVADLKPGKYLTPEKRDVILYKALGDHISQMDEADKDMLYKSIIHYSKDRATEKYPFLKSTHFETLKKQLQ